MKKKLTLSTFFVASIGAMFLFLIPATPEITICKAEVGLSGGALNGILGSLELPFLLIAVVFSFLTANRLKGGKFGTGMQFMAWGFLVMAVGHLHMQIDHFYGFNLFNTLLGEVAGSIAWFVALIITWGLSSTGFYKIYHASKM
ncbi:hypothetical protein [Persicobacter psychrovividus]|uniref:Uncharacterized protein n=1 Tax=Persicobacter psychrovividus TaxID=387638 RepID=A0ABN6LHT4_9BACT|nr:hypothetical protein PEPS_33890 [Persicobacter psychrovividus]